MNTTSASTMHQSATPRQGRVRTLTLQVPDTSRPGFAAACRRQSRRLGASQQDTKEMVWVETAQSDILDDEPW